MANLLKVVSRVWQDLTDVERTQLHMACVLESKDLRQLPFAAKIKALLRPDGSLDEVTFDAILVLVDTWHRESGWIDDAPGDPRAKHPFLLRWSP